MPAYDDRDRDRDATLRHVTRRVRLAFAFVTLLGTSMLAPPAVADTTSTDPSADAGAPSRETLEGPRLDALLADIAKARKEMKTLRASFTQERRIALLATSVKSRGELLVAAPSRLRWELLPPDDVVYFVGPEGLAYKTKSSTASLPANSAKVARGLEDLRALLTGDLTTLRVRYTLSATQSPTDVEISGVSKEKSGSLRAFSLVLGRDLVTPLRARLTESKNDKVDLTFTHVVLNGTVDAARLRP